MADEPLRNLEEVAQKLRAVVEVLNGKPKLVQVVGGKLRVTMPSPTGDVVTDHDLPVGPAANVLNLTWDHDALLWRMPDGSPLDPANPPVWSSYDQVSADASSALNTAEIDMSVLGPAGVEPTVTMSAADTAGLVTVAGGAGGNATMTPLTDDQLQVP